MLVPLPAPGAPPSRISSLGNRSLLAAEFLFELLPDPIENQLRVLDLQVGGVRCSRQGEGGSFLTLPRANIVILHRGGFHAPNQLFRFSFATKPDGNALGNHQIADRSYFLNGRSTFEGLCRWETHGALADRGPHSIFICAPWNSFSRSARVRLPDCQGRQLFFVRIVIRLLNPEAAATGLDHPLF